ncbi:MAG TPA: hypothetical protein VLA89_14030 [Gemmatimonadales bacterium]|nr:hypothetical protein [Gemmatimonadales bacterium]
MADRQHRRSNRPPSPSRLSRLAALPTGPKYLRLRADPEQMGGPGEPPPGFVTASTSRSEWAFYWAAAIATGTPRDPREPPFTGGDWWVYQRPFDQGRGSAVIDFVFFTAEGKLAIRIQTYQYHFHTDAFKQAVDRLQAQYLGRFFKVIDVNEEDLIRDKSGQEAVKTVKSLLAGYVFLDPLKAGTVTDAG